MMELLQGVQSVAPHLLQGLANATSAVSSLVDPTGLTLTSVKAAQGLLAVVNVLQLTAIMYPPNYEVQDNEEFDYVIIGGGTGGCVLANRLTENEKHKVLLIEAGGNPPIEAQVPGLFTVLPKSKYDYNFPTVNDNYSAQHLQEKSVQMTAGKMLGGSNELHHLLHVRGDPYDYSRWSAASGDSSWEYESLLPYFKKSENVMDKAILNSSTADLHGTSGDMKVTREPKKENINLIRSFEEVGYKKNLDINSFDTLGITEPLLTIYGGRRTTTATAYLSPIKDRKNLYVWKHATATKILFDDDKNAYGVEVINSKNKKITAIANKEVILAAGAVKSSQLLLLSGIGPKSHLRDFNITAISDLPVGENLQDHTGALILCKLKKNIGPNLNGPLVITEFPAPVTIGNGVLDMDQKYPDYQCINIFFPNNAFIRLPELCASTFKYENKVCNIFYKANLDREAMLSVVTKHRPLSTGTVRLISTDPLANPEVNLGYFTNPKDLDDIASYLMDFARLVNTTYFKSVNADFVDVELPECTEYTKYSYEYWKCYALSMSTTIWHYCGTNALGTVLDNKLRVRGVQKLRVADASALPNIVSGNIMSAVMALAEKGADLIKEDASD